MRGRLVRWFPSRQAVLAAIVLMIPWVLITVPGKNILPQGIQQGLWIHGWPFVHTVNARSREPANQLPGEGLQDIFSTHVDKLLVQEFPFNVEQPNRFWTQTENWRYDAQLGLSRWSLKNLIANLGIGLGIFAVHVAGLEYRKRKRGSLCRITLLDSLALVSMVCVLLAVVVNEKQGAENDDRLLERLKEIVWIEGWTQQSSKQIPEWLDRLFDCRIEQAVQLVDPKASLQRVQSLICHCRSPGSSWGPEDPGEFAGIVNELGCLKSILFVPGRPADFEMLKGLQSDSIESLSVSFIDSTGPNYDFSFLEKMPNLKSLIICLPNTRYVYENTFGRDLIGSLPLKIGLESLDLGEFAIGLRECEQILKQRSLRTLTIAKPTPEVREALLAGNPNLQVIERPVLEQD